MKVFDRLVLKICRYAVKLGLKRPCPTLIPIGGNDSKSVNCVGIQAGGAKDDWPFLVEGIVEEGLTCKQWDGESYSTECLVPNAGMHFRNFKFRRFYQRHQFDTESVLVFLLMEITGWPYVAVGFDNAVQRIFNTKRLVRSERMVILNRLVLAACENPFYKISAVILISQLYSSRAWLHPQMQPMVEYYRYVLDSLVETKDLKRDGILYTVEPKAMVTIADYECEERRHRAIVHQQRLLIALTVVLAIVGGVQAFAALMALRK